MDILSSVSCKRVGMYSLCAVPSTTRELPEDYLQKVKQVHEIGGYGSKGYAIVYVIDYVMLVNKFLTNVLFSTDIGTSGKGRKRRKICSELTRPQFLQECFTNLLRRCNLRHHFCYLKP